MYREEGRCASEMGVAYSPISTDMKNRCKGIPSMGDVIFRNQFGDMGKRRSEMRMSRRLC